MGLDRPVAARFFTREEIYNMKSASGKSRFKLVKLEDRIAPTVWCGSVGGSNHGSHHGGSNKGGSHHGGSNKGGSHHGGSHKGGSHKGGSHKGGSHKGGSHHGGPVCPPKPCFVPPKCK
jgi:hypothetical protein